MKPLLFLFVIFLINCQFAIAQQNTNPANDDVFLKDFAFSIAKPGKGNLEQAEIILNWLSNNFQWYATDYQNRTVREIIERKGGNCYELAKTFMSLIRQLGIKHRNIAEINVQLRDSLRGADAAVLVTEKGNAASVFGLSHNDHRWVEILDEKTGAWIPCDPSMGVFGLDNWLKARLWFGKRETVNSDISKTMLIPVAIFVMSDTGKNIIVEDRTSFYLVDAFDHLYGDRLHGLVAWSAWKTKLLLLAKQCRYAFEGKENLLLHEVEFEECFNTYRGLKCEFLEL